MTDYDVILDRCNHDSAVISRFVDEFLVYYCDDREDMTKQFNREIGRFAHRLEAMPDEWYRRVLMQYIAFRLFRRGGFVKAYRGHAILRTCGDEERAWLEAQIDRPWRWSFCRAQARVQENFYRMIDVCTNEHFLLYSPGMTRILNEGTTPMMWLLLLTDNGLCRQTYGPLLPLQGLFAHDVLLFTRQLDARMRRFDQVPACIDDDPFPYLMLWWGSKFPVMVHNKDIIMFNRRDLEHVRLDPTRVVRRFSVEHASGVTRLRLKYWSRHPHFAEAYHDSTRATLIATAMTDRGWLKLVQALREVGVDIPEEADIRGSVNATLLFGRILDRDLADHPYIELFERPVPREEQDSLDRINDFITIWVEAWNEGKKFNFEEAARSTGVDPREARGILTMIEKRFKDMPPPWRGT